MSPRRNHRRFTAALLASVVAVVGLFAVGAPGGSAQTIYPTPPPACDNNFTVKKVVVTPKGAVKITVNLPGPGTLSAQNGKGIKSKTKTADAAGPFTIAVTLNAKSQKTLKRTGRVKIKVKLVYTPQACSGPSVPKSKTIVVTVHRKT
jgi:hypothetical protein